MPFGQMGALNDFGGLGSSAAGSSGGGAAFVGSGNIKSGAFAYWSVARAYNAAYATSLGPAIDLLDQGGAHPITINVKNNGLVDVAAINAWVTANTVTTIKVTKLYDQTGNGRHVTQATLANMPNLLLSHPALGNAAIPVMDFLAASSQKLVSAATGLNQATGTFSIVSRQSHLSIGSFGALIQAATFGTAHTASSGGGGITMFATSVPTIPAYDEIFLLHQTVYNGASSFACINGVVSASVNPGASNLGSPFTIGLLNNANPLTGQISEIRFDASVWSSGDCLAEYANQTAFFYAATAHEGFVASRCRDKATLDTTNGFVMARSAHIASENLIAVRVLTDNESGVGITTITQSIEFPSGTFTQLKFLGSASGTIQVSNQTISDYATVSIPAGSTFWVRTFWNNANTTSYYNTWQNTFLGEATQLSATSISDLTMGGTITNSGAFSMPPQGIIGVTTNPSAIIIGDSIAAGLSDVEDSSNSATGFNGKVGYLARSISCPFVNMARVATQSNQGRARLARAFGSHLLCEFGVNDFFTGSQTSAQLITRLHAILDLRRSKQKVFQTVITPETTSTDAWATIGNQTLVSAPQDTQRITFNTALRGVTSGLTTLTGFIDTASIVESSLNSGKWIVTPTPPYTNDGIHPTVSGHNLLIAAAVVPVPTWP
jgi:hypothetical protein